MFRTTRLFVAASLLAFVTTPGCGDDDDTVTYDSRPNPDSRTFDAPSTIDTPPMIDAPPMIDSGADAMSMVDGGADAMTGIDAAPGSAETCDTAHAITAGTETGQMSTGMANNYGGTTCLGYDSPGPDHVYSISVPAGQVLTVTVTPDVATDFDSVVMLVDSLASCTADPTCVAGADRTASGAETTTYTNETAAAVTLYIIVDGYDVTDFGTYTLTTALATIMAGETCGSATVIATPGTLTAQTTVGFASNYSGGGAMCTGFSNSGPDRVYSISVPAGQQLIATVTPTAWDAAIYLISPLANCTATPMCLTGSDSGGTGVADMAMWRNTGSGVATVYIVIDGYIASQSGVFDLTTVVAP